MTVSTLPRPLRSLRTLPVLAALAAVVLTGCDEAPGSAAEGAGSSSSSSGTSAGSSGSSGSSSSGADDVDEPAADADPSPEAFCDVYWEQKEQFLDKYAERQADTDELGESDPLSAAFLSLASGFESIGDAVRIFDHLEVVAPDDIRPDVTAVRDALQKSIDDAPGAVSDPLTTLAGGLVTGFTTAGSWQRVGDYVVEHCGETP